MVRGCWREQRSGHAEALARSMPVGGESQSRCWCRHRAGVALAAPRRPAQPLMHLVRASPRPTHSVDPVGGRDEGEVVAGGGVQGGLLTI